jgi:transcriptional regulator with XRE-family HTH domain
MTMEFGDRQSRRFIAKVMGQELRQAREVHEWSRAHFVARMPSGFGIGERTLLAYEHGLRELAVWRLVQLCQALGVDAPGLLNRSLQQAGISLENISLHIDVRAVLDSASPKFRPMKQWARNKLNRHADGVVELAPASVIELADFVGCAHDELRIYLARFMPDFEHILDG